MKNRKELRKNSFGKIQNFILKSSLYLLRINHQKNPEKPAGYFFDNLNKII